MAKEKKFRDRITIEVDPATGEAIRQWAALEGRTISNLVRRLLCETLGQRMIVRGAAPRSSIQKQQLTA